MKIAGIKVTKEQVMIASCAILVVALMYFLFFRPMMRAVGVKSRAYTMIEAQVRDARAIIEAAAKVSGERDLVTEKQVPAAIEEFTKHGKAMKITFQSIRPRELKKDPKSNFRVLPLDIAIEADDKQMVAFMGSLDELKKSLITITAFDVVPDKDDPYHLEAAMMLNMYFLPGETSQGK